MFTISLDSKSRIYQPSDAVTGVVVVDKTQKMPSTLEVRLVWATRGKGDKDEEQVDIQAFIPRAIADSGKFKFSLHIPEKGPYSFNGKLIALSWRVELADGDHKGIFAKDRIFSIENILVSPTGREIQLAGLERLPPKDRMRLGT